MVAPQVPTGHAIGHVVLNHQSHGRLLYPVGVLALERGEVGLIGRKGATTGQTAMCGVANMQVDRSAAEGVAEIMNGAGGHTPAATAPPTERAAPAGEVAAAQLDARPGPPHQDASFG